MQIGDKVIIKEKICANNLPNPHYNRIATILEEPDRFDRVLLSIDDFPNCNHREYHNRFYYDINELELVKEGE
jgi:hypothetical protein